MKQYEMVINVMAKNGGYATLGFLHQNVYVKDWKTKTPFASIRRIVQDSKYFFKIRPGLWALKSHQKEVLKEFNIESKKKADIEKFNHTYYQGLIVEIGNLKGYKTYVPPQDRNKLFLAKKLAYLAGLDRIYEFTYEDVLRKAKTIDVIWFNDRKYPNSLFEVEHTTDIYNSLIKFYDLQDFNTKFHIVSSVIRKREFEQKINSNAFQSIKNKVHFIDYDFISDLHTKTFELAALGSL